ncbi:hypothetical protein [Aromatoleum evansii]|uniref:hypothetical protein n=1 Tax=Aromatoleum evansii TaxID=59406 RepID=UPI00145CDCA3|nr:hypothetical protein [Aromatoleum evansii]NMG28408.1 hypothetical protein [Aromatoleum evansii]
MTEVIEIKDKVEVKSVDDVLVIMPIPLIIRVIEERVEDAYNKLVTPTGQVKTWALNALRSSAEGFKLEELY